MRRTRLVPAVAALALVTSSLAASAAKADLRDDGPCDKSLGPTSGGDWTSYGADASNSRSQLAEHEISTASVAALAPAWVFSVAAAGGKGGSVNSTPTEYGGCVFFGDANGDVFAVNAATGKAVWHTELPFAASGLGGAIVGATVVHGHSVYVLVSDAADGTPDTGQTTPPHGPYAVALDRDTGAMKWRSRPFDTHTGDYTNASPAVIEVGHAGRDQAGWVLLAGFSPPEGDPSGQGGFVVLDAQTGSLLRRTYSVDPADRAVGQSGGGIWSTAAWDPASGFAYDGGGNPFNKSAPSRNTDAILKIDLRGGSPTFGQIVNRYQGNVDQYNAALAAVGETPLCAASAAAPDPLDDPVCGQLDLDFGAAPNLFRNASGRLLVGDLQKAGVYHAAAADTMAPAWKTIVGAPCAVCNAASTAIGSGRVLGVGTPTGIAFGLDGSSGTASWRAPIADGVHYESTSFADGVMYTFDTEGFLDALDAATGQILVRHQMAADTGQPMSSNTSGGVAIARHEVIVAANGGTTSTAGYVIAYRTPTVAVGG